MCTPHQQSQISDQKKSKRLTMSEHRGHEQHEIEPIGDMVDHISNLPDCVLHHILSFMPTKQVVRTSILSTRWRYLWAVVPNIDFDDELFDASEVDGWNLPEATSFVNFVDSVLCLRDAINIEKFRLSCRGCYDASQIQSWISDAIMHNVEELDLYLLTADPSVIPRSMFNSPSLASLKIEMCCVVELPPETSFPCLKTLHLSLVTFPDNTSTQNLFSGCPVLEELVLLECEWMNLNNIVISSSTLRSLTITDAPYYGPVNVYDSSGCKIKIDADNLTYLDYSGYLLNEILLDNVSSLVKARIHIPTLDERQKELTCRVVDLLERLRYVVSLSVSKRSIESYMVADNMRVRCQMFPNLSHLILTTEIGNKAFGALMDLLYLCPILKSICFFEGFEHRMHLGEDDSIWFIVPICMSNCLKSLTFKNFHAYSSEICFLKCVLKYACVLEMIDIWWSQTELRDPKRQTEVKTELETSERSSAACVVKFA